MRSLRRTLFVRFSLTMFAALLVIALWAYLGTRRILRGELDRGLAAAAHIESSLLAAGYALPLQLGHPVADDFVREINRFVVVRDRRGTVLAANTPLAVRLPLDTASLASAAAGGTTWTTATWNEDELRSVYVGMSHDRAGDERVLQVAALLTPINMASRQVLLLMLGTVALGTVATILGGGWLARSAVAPVGEIAAQAESIAPGTVGQRITAHAEVAEFNGLVGVLNRMLERLDRGLLAQRRVIADVGHDLRTPLTAMQGEVEVTLRNPRAPEQYQQVLRSLLEEINHLATISDTLLLLARVEAGELAPQRMETDLCDLSTQAARRLRQRATDHTVVCEVAADPAATAPVDGRMVALVLDHLLDNAVRHTPPGTSVTVSLYTAPDAVNVVVADGGPGVPDEALPHLFERFYRGDAARGRGAGAGLGLTVAAAIVNAHGGVIRAERNRPSGLRVTVSLPRLATASTS